MGGSPTKEYFEQTVTYFSKKSWVQNWLYLCNVAPRNSSILHGTDVLCFWYMNY